MKKALKANDFEDVELDLSNYDLKIEYPNIHIGTAEAYSGITPKQTKTNIKELIKTPITIYIYIYLREF